MAGNIKQEDDEMITAINVTPLVDIVLVLLIVLMVTSSYLVNKAINVELPKAATGEATSPTLAISIDQTGKIFLDGAPITAPELKGHVHSAYQKDPDVKAIISADGRVHHSEVVSVIDLLRLEKVTKFAINTSPIQEKTQ
ncbi:MAG: ExbD/TolR family protein [Polyangiales bacterium]